MVYKIYYIIYMSLEMFLSVTRCMVYTIYYIIYMEFRKFLSLASVMVYTIYYIIYMEFRKVSLSDQMYGIYNLLYNKYWVYKGFSQWPDVWYIQYII